MRVLVLGGTDEARRLAAELVDRPELEVVSSLAGRVRRPSLPAGQVRIGGFGGVDGLAAWLRDERIGCVIDATHPFAARITAAAVDACRRLGLPLAVLRRPGWTAGEGDDWRRVATPAAAAEALEGLGERVFLTIGRTALAAFAGLDRYWFLVRAVDPPEPPLPRRMRLLLDRGPFTVRSERALFTGHRIQVLVAKDSGGELTAAKLTVARELGLPVVLQDRPAPPAAEVVPTVAEAVAWLAAVPGYPA